MDPLGALKEEEWVFVVSDGVKDDGDVAVTGGHLGMVLTKHQQEEVASSAEEESNIKMQCHNRWQVGSKNNQVDTNYHQEATKNSSPLHISKAIFQILKD